ncbi:uncharacterized protein EHS24_001652 [Apiotrichum porosum]|uniref:Uncharacterized protein n=1 Tax=Apiotrichum porosum TaxID=105984 RepID=A0A427XIV0_9TREE|nr:uncharacterized protein EHS24_001652 [Apiotrichum porosum]RSH78748.1 hypothetical protein EHS24_001652 [Apiotrichum porosum]
MRSAILAILLVTIGVAAAPLPPATPHPPRDAVGGRAPNPGDPEMQKRLNPRPPSYAPRRAVLVRSEDDNEKGLEARFIGLGPGLVTPPPKTDHEGGWHDKRDGHPGETHRGPSSDPPANAGRGSTACPASPPGKRDAGGDVEARFIGLGPGIVEPPPDDKA